jgi:flagellar motor switch protein FliG
VANEEGLRKSAILLLTLDEDASAEVFKHLPARMIQELSQVMATLGHVSHEEMRLVLEEFYEESERYALLVSLNSNDYVRNVLTKVLGTERAASLLEDIMDSRQGTTGIDALNLIEPSTVAEMIRDEHPQIIATILVHLERYHAAEVVKQLDDKLRDDVMLRIATFSGVQPSALAELTEVLGGMLDGQNLKRSKMGGVKTAAEILNLLNAGVEEGVIDAVRAYNEDLAQRIIDEMFLFENLAEVDDRAVMLLLRDVDPNSLSVALKGVSPTLLNKFTRNMSQRAAQLLIEDMDNLGPVLLSRVQAEQKAILQIARRLADSGEIELSRGEESYV